MDFYYELFFDGDDINDFWGTAETVLDGDVYELCAQLYYVHVDENAIDTLELDYEVGVRDNDEMEAVLDQYHSPITAVADVDLVNCVYPDTRECLYAFREINEDEYYSHVG